LTLPAKPKTNFIQKKILVCCGIGGIAITIASVIFFAFPSSTTYDNYSILVDPTKEQQSLFIIARVLIQNTSSESLTNLAIDYGEGDKDFIGTLKPGQTIILSPPDGNPLQYVTVTADNDIYVFKAYREPVAMPGMMGS
jgi:hypothetical protein